MRTITVLIVDDYRPCVETLRLALGENVMSIAALISCLAIFSGVLTGFVNSANAQIFTPDTGLAEHISEALRNNPDLAVWQHRIEAAENKVPQAGAWQDPTVKFSLMNLPVNSFDFNQEGMTGAWITVGQTIPLAGRPTIMTDIAGFNLATTDANRQTHELNVAEQLAQIWYDWAYLNEALRTLNVNIDLLDDLIIVARSKYETGAGLQQDILRAETSRTRQEDMRVKLRQMILTTGRRFATLMGRQPDDVPKAPQSLPESFAKVDTRDLIQRLFADNPAWHAMDSQVEASKSRVELAKRAWIPNLQLGAAYGYRQDADLGAERPDFFTVTAGISVPLYGKRKQSAAIQEMSAMLRASASRKRSLELDLRLKLEKLLDEDNTLEQQVLLYREGVEPQAEATLAASTVSYSVGKADFEAVLMAETVLYNARLERLARVRDRLKVRASLAALMGGDDLIPNKENNN